MKRALWYMGGTLLTLGAVLRSHGRREDDSSDYIPRMQALDLLADYIPADPGDGRYEEIAKDYGGKGTTCGYLPPWLFYRMGVRVPRLVNRSEPNASPVLTYSVGMNISRVRYQPEFVLFRGTVDMLPVDTFFVSDGPSITEHVGMVLSKSPEGIYLCAEGGQRNDKGEQCFRLVERHMKNSRFARVDGIGTPRLLVGWLPFRAVMEATK